MLGKRGRPLRSGLRPLTPTMTTWWTLKDCRRDSRGSSAGTCQEADETTEPPADAAGDRTEDLRNAAWLSLPRGDRADVAGDMRQERRRGAAARRVRASRGPAREAKSNHGGARAQAERTAERAAKEKELEERGIKKIKDEARAAGLPLPEDFNNAPPTIADRFLSTLLNLLHLTDSLSYSGHIFSTFLEQLEVFSPLVAIQLAYRAIPFSHLIAFFGLQFLATKPEVNKLVRFNLRQAVNIDVALFFPPLLGLLAKIVVGDDPTGNLPPLANAGSDIVFAAVVLAVLYSCVSSALGIIPTKLPVLGKMNRENPDRDSDDFYTPGGGRR
ncbi:unnamed protein product [Discosporangium mesarthrocarpum]